MTRKSQTLEIMVKSNLGRRYNLCKGSKIGNSPMCSRNWEIAIEIGIRQRVKKDAVNRESII